MRRPQPPLIRLFAVLALFAASTLSVSAQLGGLIPSLTNSLTQSLSKLDPLLRERMSQPGQSRVIVRATDAASLGAVTSLIRQLGGVAGVALPIIDAQAAVVPNASLALLSVSPLIAHMSFDRVAAGANERTGATVGATATREDLGVDGSGVGVAIIDSGVTTWHDDLVGRVDRFVDLVNARVTAYDDYGHGTHVAGIIAGNGYDSGGARTGIAPGAHLVAVKALDASGQGRISDVIAALGYVVLHRDELNVRVINLSIATGVYESYYADPLTLAALAAVRSGLVVVAAAGNNGRSAQGRTQYGGITSPGNAPWVLTVGASSHMGTADRRDDTMAAFSSRGPAAADHNAKPDLVAPGVGIESLSDPDSAFYRTKPYALLAGTVPTSYLPYLSLSGTSMSTPVVSGTVALMLQANPSLTPNAVKAILQYTAQTYAGWDALTQGAGFLNARGAVELARLFASSPATATLPRAPGWSGRLLWGNRLAWGGRLTAGANAWSSDVVWGAATAPYGQTIVWGVIGNRAWTQADSRNAVWGSTCGGADCTGLLWSPAAASDGDTVVWGTSDGDTVVWGTSDGDTVVWGTSDGDTVVWGTSCDDPSCMSQPWGH